MLTPSPIQRFNVEPTHPHFVPELEEQLVRDDIVVTVNEQPVAGVIGFSVPDGYVKRLATNDDLQRVAREGDENKYARVCREGVRVKGQVRVFIRT